MLVPLYGFVEGDTMGVLVLTSPDMSLAQVQQTLSESASLRVDPEGSWCLVAGERQLPPELTVADVGLTALSRIDLKRRST